MNKLSSRTGVRIVALFEAAKGSLVLLAGLGLFSLIHHDVQDVAERIVKTLHMDPARKYPAIFIEAASKVSDANLWKLAWLAVVYAAIRLAEAYGLWNKKKWAEWFAVVSGGIYLPVEVYEIFHRFTWIKVGVFLGNVAIVIYLAVELHRSRSKKVP